MIFSEIIRDAVALGSGPPHFTRRTKRKKNGKQRVFFAPNAAMRAIHRQILRFARRLLERHFGTLLPHITGSRRGCSFVENATRHGENRYFYGVDLVRAFHGVRLNRLVGLISSLDTEVRVSKRPSRNGRERELFNFFRRYCYDAQQGGLMEGPPASPDLFNLYCAATLDRQLAELAMRYGLVYTRYVDDLTFSSRRPITRSARREIRAAIQAAGFWVNHAPDKSFYADLYRRQQVLITGVWLHSEGPGRPVRYYLGKRYVRRLERMLAFFLKGKCDELPAADQDRFNRRLRGTWQCYRQTTLANTRRTRRDCRLIQNYRAYRAIIDAA
jgi:hypothetical protein